MEQPGVIVPLPDMVPTSSELPPEGCPVMAGTGEGEHDVLYYWDYLHLDELLNSQTPKSAERGGLVHDETFFIVVHQTYELWFKQILVELDSVLDAHERRSGFPSGTWASSWPGCSASIRSSSCWSVSSTSSRR